jgi:hypothetical protein
MDGSASGLHKGALISARLNYLYAESSHRRTAAGAGPGRNWPIGGVLQRA